MSTIKSILILCTAFAGAGAHAAVTLPYSEDFQGGSASDFTSNGNGSWSVLNSTRFEGVSQNVYQNVSDNGSGGNVTGTVLSASYVDVTGLGASTQQDFSISTRMSLVARGGSGANRDVNIGLFVLGDASANNGYALTFDAFGPANGNAIIWDIASGTPTSVATSTGTLSAGTNSSNIYTINVTGTYGAGGSLTLDVVLEHFDGGVSQGTVSTSFTDATPYSGTHFGFASIVTDGQTTFQNDAIQISAVPEPAVTGALFAGFAALTVIYLRRRR